MPLMALSVTAALNQIGVAMTVTPVLITEPATRGRRRDHGRRERSGQTGRYSSDPDRSFPDVPTLEPTAVSRSFPDVT
jgi:hypothetical protein